MQSLITFAVAHEALLSTLGVAILDLAFAINKNAESNGILHFVYLQLQKMSGKSPQQPPQA